MYQGALWWSAVIKQLVVDVEHVWFTKILFFFFSKPHQNKACGNADTGVCHVSLVASPLSQDHVGVVNESRIIGWVSLCPCYVTILCGAPVSKPPSVLRKVKLATLFQYALLHSSFWNVYDCLQAGGTYDQEPL